MVKNRFKHEVMAERALKDFAWLLLIAAVWVGVLVVGCVYQSKEVAKSATNANK